MKRRDAHLSEVSTPPAPEIHINNAVLEAWADDVLDEAQVMEQIAKCHPNGETCKRCLASVDYYRQRLKVS